MATSTPNNTREGRELRDDTEISIISAQAEAPVLISDDEIEEALRVLSNECHQQSHDVDVHEQSTLRLDTPDQSRSPRNYTSCCSPELEPKDQSKKVNFDLRLEKHGKTLANEKSKIIENESTAAKITQSPRKQSLNPRPELVQDSRKRRKLPVAVSEITQNETVHSISENNLSPRKRKFQISKQKHPKNQNEIPVAGKSQSSSSNQSETENSMHEENQSPRKQRKFQIFKRKSPRKENETPVAQENQSANNQSDYKIPQTDPVPKTCQSSISLCDYPIPGFSEKEIWKTPGAEESQITNEQYDYTIPQNSPLPEASQSSMSLCDCQIPEVSEKDIQLERFPKKRLSVSKNNEEVSSNDCQCQCSCVEDELINLLPTTSKKSTLEKTQWWLISPDEIKKSLEAIRQSFLGKVEDNASKLYKSLVYPPCTLTSNNTENTSNLQTEIFPSSSSNKRDISSSNLRKDIKIEIPSIINKCDFCDSNVECEEDKDGCYQNNPEVQNSVMTQITESSKSLNLLQLAASDLNVHDTGKRNVKIQVPHGSSKCDFCETSEECGEEIDRCRERHQEVENPERTNLQALGDDSALESRKDPLGCENDPNDRSAEPRRILQVKIVKKERKEDSGGGSSCPGGCERYYRDKLMATLQILENKDETIRVQGSSLGVAEGRIAELSKRASALQAELEHKARELTKLQQFADSCRVDKSDVSIMAETEDVEAQKHVVATLKDNLSVIAELYRECFYETAKQEELIELLRKSYLDVRLMEKDKADKITRLQNVINTQKRSIEQCQDVVIEVESLKSEISFFLNSSNNDSGMWERGSENGEVGEELADILDQLRQLQDMLTGDCTCGLEEENRSLKEKNEALEIKLELLGQRNGELDDALRKILDQQYEKKIKEKERELQEAYKRLEELENTCKDKNESCESLTRQLQQAQVMLKDKSAELAGVQQTCAALETTIRRLEEKLDRSEQHVQEGMRKLAEASRARAEQQAESRAAAAQLELRLQRVAQRCRELDVSCREKQCSLEEAHARGARLCEESRRVAACLREWMRCKRQLVREQQEKIERQESMLRDLQRRSEARQNMTELTSQSETEPSSSHSLQRGQLTSDTSYPRRSRVNKSTCTSEIAFPRCGASLARCAARGSEAPRCGTCGPGARRRRGGEAAAGSKCSCADNRDSGSGTARCAQAPVPPQRQKKKQQPADDLDWACSPRGSAARLPPPPPCGRAAHAHWMSLPRRRAPRSASPPALLERLAQLQAAMEGGQRRWRRRRS